MMGFFNSMMGYGYPFMMNGYAYQGLWFWGMCLLLWTLPWKGYALWLAARRGEKGWFVAILLFNTLAILEILYIFVFSGEKGKTAKKKK